MSDIEWKDWHGVPVTVENRNEWGAGLARIAQGCQAEKAATDFDWHATSSMRSGDSFVHCTLNFDGSIDLLDCIVRRTARIAPKEHVWPSP